MARHRVRYRALVLLVSITLPFPPSAAEEAPRRNTLQDDVATEDTPREDAPGDTVEEDRSRRAVPAGEESVFVRSVELRGNERFRDEELRALLKTRPGAPLETEAIEEDRRQLLATYHEDGFLFAGVDVRVDPLPLRGARLMFDIAEGRRVRLERVAIEGNERFSDGELIAASGLTPARLLGLLARGRYVPGSITGALGNLRGFYQENGFLDAIVELESMRLDPTKTRLFAVIRVIEGPRYRIGRVAIQGAEVFPEELLRRRVELAPGESFSAEKVRAAQRRLVLWYLEHSDLIPEVRVDVRKRVVSVLGDPPRHEANLVFLVAEGRHRFVRHVEIRGNWRTRDRVVRRHIDPAPGDVLVPSEIESTRANLSASGLFENAEVRLEETGDPRLYDVVVDVTEKERPGWFGLGGGASSGAGEVFYARLESDNFDLFRLPRSLTDWHGAFSGGGQTLRIEVIPGSRESEFRALFREPYFLSSRNALTLRGSGRLRERLSYDETRTGGEAEIRHFLDRDHRLSLALGYRIENVLIDDIELPAPPDVEAARGFTFLAYPSASFLYEDLEINPFAGPEGLISEVRLDVAESVTGSDLDFTRLTVSGDLFVPFFEHHPDFRHTLRVGAELGWIEGLDSDPLPLFERFFMGGPRSFRGFEYRGLGPHQLDTPVGGQALLRGTVQYSLPLFIPNVRAVAVFDWGNLEPDLDGFSTGRFRTAAGGGLELRLPFPFARGIVPVNLYWVQPLASQGGDREQLFTFTLGLGF